MGPLSRKGSASILLAIVLACFMGCDQRTTVVVPSAFHWRNNDPLNYNDRQAIAANGLQRIYFKILDIGWNPANGAYPVSSVAVPIAWRNYSGNAGMWTDSVEFVPSIYITNSTFAKITDAEVDQLAANLLRKLRMECPLKIHGVLLDCDWTATTKSRFFRLTRIMNDSLDVPLMATIRLHQFAHPGKTGVPPADRGMLMVYNVGKVNAPGAANSIFNKEETEPYFRRSKPYPLPLDIALPAFSWGAHFRKGHFMGILQEAQIDEAAARGMLTGSFTGTMQVTKENNDRLPELHLGDEIRMERMTADAINQVAQLARGAVNSDTTAVVFFELGTRAFRCLAPSFVDSVYLEFGPRTVRKDALPFPAFTPSSVP